MSQTKIVELANVIEWEEGWDFIQEGIEKVQRILEGQQESFSAEENMLLYTLVYNMCSQRPPHSYEQQLYDKYKETLDEYISSTVLPALSEKHDAEFMLKELVKRWENHKLMVVRLSRFFHYLERSFVLRMSLPSLNEVGLTCFHNLVYQELRDKAINAVIVLIEKEREGEQIDRALLKNNLDIFVGIGNWKMEYYVNDFEVAMLRDTASYYSRKASSWIEEYSYSDYLLKAEECLKKEKDRVSHYLHVSSETKLLEIVKNELLVYTNPLLKKEHSGFRALLIDDKVASKIQMSQTKIVELENIIKWEEGWDFIQEGIKKVMRILEGQQESFSTEENMMLYSLIYNMCSQKCPLAEKLYDKYKEALDEYINSTVLPALREKHDAELMLRELVKRWENHKLMVMRLSRFFYYLNRYFIPRKSLPSLNEVGLTCFRDLVYQELRGKAINAVIVLIGKEREGEQIDRALLKNVLDIFVGIGNWNMEYYVNDFEDAMLRDTAAYYSRKASSWIVEDSYPDYMLKAEECLKKEKDRVSHYLHVSSETKLLEKVKNELLVVYTNQLHEKEHSGSRALLRDDKADSSGSFGQMIP